MCDRLRLYWYILRVSVITFHLNPRHNTENLLPTIWKACEFRNFWLSTSCKKWILPVARHRLWWCHSSRPELHWAPYTSTVWRQYEHQHPTSDYQLNNSFKFTLCCKRKCHYSFALIYVFSFSMWREATSLTHIHTYHQLKHCSVNVMCF